MRCYCSCLRGDLGIILLRKVISISLLFPAPPVLCPHLGDTHSKSLQWLAAGLTRATAVRDSRISGIFYTMVCGGAPRHWNFEQAL